MVADTVLSSAPQRSEATVIRGSSSSAMDLFARQIIERELPFSMKMDGVSPDILESDLIDVIRETGVLDFVPRDAQVGLSVETSEDSGEYCAKLSIGSHKLRVFLAKSANELNLEDEKAIYSEMRLYDGKGGQIEVDPPQTVSVTLKNTGTSMSVSNPLDPIKYDELKKATQNGPQLVVLYYHDGNEGTFSVENDTDETLGARLNALVAGDLSMTEVMEDLQNHGELSPETVELIEALAEYQDLLAETASLEGAENNSETLRETAAELEGEIETMLEQGIDVPEDILQALHDTFEIAQETAQEMGLHTEEPDLADLSDLSTPDVDISDSNVLEPDAANMEVAESLVDLIETLSEQLEVGEIDALPPEVLELLENIDDIEALIEEHGREEAVQQIAEALADPDGAPELSQSVQNIVLSLDNPEVQLALPQDALNQTYVFLENHLDVVDAVVRDSIVQNLQSALEDMGPGTEEARAIENAIEQLQAGEDIASLDVEVLNEIKEHANILVAENLEQVIQAIENTGADPVILSNETRENLRSLPPETQEALAQADTDVSEILQTLHSDPDAAISAEDMVKLGAAIEGLSPELQTEIGETLTNNVQSAVDVQAELSQPETASLSENTQNADVSSHAEFSDDSNVIDAREIFQQASEASPETEMNLQTEATTPEVAAPEVATPEVATPEVATPEVAAPEVATPEVATPEVATPEVATLEDNAPTSDCGTGSCGHDHGHGDDGHDHKHEHSHEEHHHAQEHKEQASHAHAPDANKPEESGPTSDCGTGSCGHDHGHDGDNGHNHEHHHPHDEHDHAEHKEQTAHAHAPDANKPEDSSPTSDCGTGSCGHDHGHGEDGHDHAERHEHDSHDASAHEQDHPNADELKQDDTPAQPENKEEDRTPPTQEPTNDNDSGENAPLGSFCDTCDSQDCDNCGAIFNPAAGNSVEADAPGFSFGDYGEEMASDNMDIASPGLR